MNSCVLKLPTTLFVITSISKLETIPNRCAASYGFYMYLEVWVSIQTGFSRCSSALSVSTDTGLSIWLKEATNSRFQ